MASILIDGFLTGGSVLSYTAAVTPPPPSGVLLRGYSLVDYGTTGDYFVDQVSGNDTNDGLTFGNAKATIQAAVDMAAGSSSTIKVASGTYKEKVVVGSGVSDGSRLVIEPYSTNQPIITGEETLTGISACDSSDSTLLGAGWADYYKVTVNITDCPSGDPMLLNLYSQDTDMILAMDRDSDTSTGWNWDDSGLMHTADSSTESSNTLVDYTKTSVSNNYNATQIANALMVLHKRSNHTYITDVSISGGKLVPADSGIELETSGGHPWRNNFALINSFPNIGQGKWCFDWDRVASTCVVYFQPPSGHDTSQITHSKRTHCVDLQDSSHVTIQGIHMTRCGGSTLRGGSLSDGAAVHLYKSGANSNITITNCKINNIYSNHAHPHNRSGVIYCRDNTNVKFDNNTIENVACAEAIAFSAGSNISIQFNYMAKVGKHPTWLQGTNNVVVGWNIIDKAGSHPHTNLYAGYTGYDHLIIANLYLNIGRIFLTWQNNAGIAMIGNIVMAGFDAVWGNAWMLKDQSSSDGGNTGVHDMLFYNLTLIPHSTNYNKANSIVLTVNDGLTYEMKNLMFHGGSLTGSTTGGNYDTSGSNTTLTYTNAGADDFSVKIGAPVRTNTPVDVDTEITVSLIPKYGDRISDWNVDTYGDAIVWSNQTGALNDFDNYGNLTTTNFRKET